MQTVSVSSRHEILLQSRSCFLQRSIITLRRSNGLQWSVESRRSTWFSQCQIPLKYRIVPLSFRGIFSSCFSRSCFLSPCEHDLFFKKKIGLYAGDLPAYCSKFVTLVCSHVVPSTCKIVLLFAFGRLLRLYTLHKIHKMAVFEKIKWNIQTQNWTLRANFLKYFL